MVRRCAEKAEPYHAMIGSEWEDASSSQAWNSGSNISRQMCTMNSSQGPCPDGKRPLPQCKAGELHSALLYCLKPTLVWTVALNKPPPSTPLSGVPSGAMNSTRKVSRRPCSSSKPQAIADAITLSPRLGKRSLQSIRRLSFPAFEGSNTIFNQEVSTNLMLIHGLGDATPRSAKTMHLFLIYVPITILMDIHIYIYTHTHVSL